MNFRGIMNLERTWPSASTRIELEKESAGFLNGGQNVRYATRASNIKTRVRADTGVEFRGGKLLLEPSDPR